MKLTKTMFSLLLCSAMLISFIGCSVNTDSSNSHGNSSSKERNNTTTIITDSTTGISTTVPNDTDVTSEKIDDLLNEAADALEIAFAPGDSDSYLTSDLTLPSTGLNNCKVSWSSDNSSVISDDGVVTRPEGDGETIDLTATLSLGSASVTKVFSLFVPPAVPEDITPPVIIAPDEITVSVGDTVSYRAGLTVTDDLDPSPTIEIDTSEVNLNDAGEYIVTYKATDSAGNTGEKQVKLTVISLEDAAKIATRDQLIKEVVEEIITDDMTTAQKGKAIYEWVYQNIRWAGALCERGLVDAGYAAFTRKSGDCYIYYAASKLLLDYCGIPNVDVERDSKDNHYWLLVDLGTGWYHFDASPKLAKQPYKAFMKTDQELTDYANSRLDGRTDYFKFDESLFEDYPRQTEPFIK